MSPEEQERELLLAIEANDRGDYGEWLRRLCGLHFADWIDDWPTADPDSIPEEER